MTGCLFDEHLPQAAPSNPCFHGASPGSPPKEDAQAGWSTVRISARRAAHPSSHRRRGFGTATGRALRSHQGRATTGCARAPIRAVTCTTRSHVVAMLSKSRVVTMSRIWPNAGISCGRHLRERRKGLRWRLPTLGPTTFPNACFANRVRLIRSVRVWSSACPTSEPCAWSPDLHAVGTTGTRPLRARAQSLWMGEVGTVPSERRRPDSECASGNHGSADDQEAPAST
jgi:hypothetical protein